METGEKSSVIQSLCYAVSLPKVPSEFTSIWQTTYGIHWFSEKTCCAALTTINPSERKVPAIMSSPSTFNRKSPCPFCGLSFIRVANHLKHCKQRHGRDYSSFLAKKPAANSRGRCLKCVCLFQRLDTHLRVSASCRQIESTANDYSARDTPRQAMNRIESEAISRALSTTNYEFLKLPKTSEEWAEADYLLESEVVPAVLQAISAEDKNSILCNRSYNVLANRFGTRPLPRVQRKRHSKLKQHNRALQKVTKEERS